MGKKCSYNNFNNVVDKKGLFKEFVASYLTTMYVLLHPSHGNVSFKKRNFIFHSAYQENNCPSHINPPLRAIIATDAKKCFQTLVLENIEGTATKSYHKNDEAEALQCRILGSNHVIILDNQIDMD